jgi:hypothetical protein
VTSPALHVGAARGRTSTGSSTVVVYGVPFTSLLPIDAVMVVRPAAPPFTWKS